MQNLTVRYRGLDESCDLNGMIIRTGETLRKHNVRFESAVLVFDDPYSLSQRDSAVEGEERWITVGAIGSGSILLVAHTFDERQDEEVIRIISARAVESHEGKPMRKLTKEQKRDIRAIAAKKDDEIDFSDARPVLDWSGAEIGKFCRPKKRPVTMRLDSDVIEWLKADGRGYQTKANWLLRSAMTHFKRRKSLSENGQKRGSAKQQNQNS